VPDAASPPLGCSFHPRCPQAFEVCGWESRDLRDLLEARWALQEEEQYEAERALIEDLGTLDVPRVQARLRTRSGRGADVLGLLESEKAENLAEPFWRGVKRMSATDDRVEVEWHEPIEPRLIDKGTVKVECHLYDDTALAEAERRRAETGAGVTTGG
jgi:peptide/nickel transport system ATP-binding protein